MQVKINRTNMMGDGGMPWNMYFRKMQTFLAVDLREKGSL